MKESSIGVARMAFEMLVTTLRRLVKGSHSIPGWKERLQDAVESQGRTGNRSTEDLGENVELF